MLWIGEDRKGAHKGSHDNARRVECSVRFADGGDNSVAAPVGGAKIHEEHLVLLVVNDGGNQSTAACEVGRSELALEDRVLEVVAEPPHELEDLAKALIVADVVADEVRSAHTLSLGRG